MEKKKRNFIALIVFAFFLLCFLFWFFWQIGSSQKEEISPKKEPTPTVSEKQKERIFLLTPKEKQVLSFWLKGEDFLYFFDKEGSLFKLDLLTSQISPQEVSFPDVKEIKISPDKKKLIVFWQREDLPPVLLDLEKKIRRILTKGISSLDFSLDSQKIIYLKKEDSSSAIFSLDLEDWQEKKIVDFPVLDTSLKVIGEDKLLLIEKPTCLYQGKLYFLDLKEKKISLWLKGKGLEAKISPKRDKVLVFFGKERVLSLYSLLTKELLKNFDFFTLAEKCGFAEEENFLVCAVPEEIDRSYCLPDDYWKGIVGFSEDILKIDLQEFSKEVLSKNKKSDIIEPFVSKKGIYFLDRKTQKLYLMPW